MYHPSCGSRLSFVLLARPFLIFASSPIHVPLTATSIVDLGLVTDARSNSEGIFHDGGGGAT
jgi:hypothetical protein